jgi:hypothetical protein
MKSRANHFEEFEAALANGLGKALAKKHKMFSWSAGRPAAIAYSVGSKRIYLLVDGTNDQTGLNLDEYFENAKRISAKLLAFVVPDQSLARGFILWGGKRRGPILVYKFRVIDPPQRGVLSSSN